MIEFTVSATSPKDKRNTRVCIKSKLHHLLVSEVLYGVNIRTGETWLSIEFGGDGGRDPMVDIPVNSVEEELEFLLAHENLVRTIALYMGRKVREKGFVWSEMRTRCEISVKEEPTAWSLTYKMTGKERVADVIPKEPAVNIYAHIASILTQ